MENLPLSSGGPLTLPSIQTRLPHQGPSFQPFFHPGSSCGSCSNSPGICFSIISHFEQMVFIKLIFLHVSLFACCWFYVLIVFSSPSGSAQALGSILASCRGLHRGAAQALTFPRTCTSASCRNRFICVHEQG